MVRTGATGAAAPVNFGQRVTAPGGVVNLYKNQGNLHIHDSGKKEIQIKREKIYTNSDGCRDIHFGK